MKISSFIVKSKKAKKALLVSVAVAILYFIVSLFFQYQNPFNIYCQSVQDTILEQYTTSKDKGFIEKLASENIDSIELSRLKTYDESNIIYQVYNKQNKLKFWTDKSLYFNDNVMNQFDSMQKLYLFNDEPYIVSLSKFNDLSIVSIVDLNRIIDNKIQGEIRLIKRENDSKSFKITSFPTDNAFEIKSSSGGFLCSIVKKTYYNDLHIIISILLIIISFVYFLKALNYYCKVVAVRKPIIASVIFGAVLYVIRKVMLAFKIPDTFYSLKLFNPSLYSSEVTPSLGDLLILLLFTQFTIVFVRRNLDINLKIVLKKYNIDFLVHSLLLVFLLGEAFSISKIFERLILESGIYFYFDYFPRLSMYSFIGLAAMLISFINYYLLSNIIIKAISRIPLSKKSRILSFVIFYLVSFFLIFYFDFKVEIQVLLLVLPIFILIFYTRYLSNWESRNLTISLFLFFASILTTYLIHSFNLKKETQVESNIAEFVGYGVGFEHSNKVKNAIINGKVSSEFHSIKLDSYQYSEYLNTWKGNRTKIYDNRDLKLYFLNNNFDRFYISRYDSSFFKIEPLFSKNIRMKKIVSEEIDRMNYSLYYQDSLLSYKGLLPSVSLNELENSSAKVYRVSENIKVHISKNQSITLTILVKFSFIFCFNILILLGFRLLSMMISDDRMYGMSFNSLRLKIMSVMILFVVIIFVTIGVVSYNNITRTINTELRNEIINNISISKKATTFINDNTQYLRDFYNKMISLYNYDIKMYNGNKIIPKYSQINENLDFEELISPIVYWKLKNGYNMIQSNDKGTTWFSFNDDISTNIISISPNMRMKKLSDTNRFFVSLMNVYVFMFFITMLLFYWLSSYITNPINKLSESLKRLSISKKNDYIQYNQKDEIGRLVSRYNKMVDEIEESTKKLAEQERGMAWNEMARQVAHEIKNPLTPMKLKIQSLQYKLKKGDENIAEEVDKLSVILVEQIDQLEYIANTFRSFSDIGQYKDEKVNWVTLIEHTMELYDTEEIDFTFNKYIEKAEIIFEHNQMISCLNNLIKNAVQSYEEEKGKICLSIGENATNYIFKVKDWGRGIPEDIRDKIFQPNFTTKNSGTGLGLAITRKIVLTYKGTINFNSVVGEGTEFVVSIPKFTN